jgi:glutamate synthase (NADPH) large chain
MEPWDGPAAIAFTDGRQIGATLDRNGLRPARFIVTDDDLVVMASDAGVLPIPDEKIVRKWRLQPGKMLLIDLEQGRIIEDDELKRSSPEQPYDEWLKETQSSSRRSTSRPRRPAPPADPAILLDRQQAFGYTQEDIQFFLEPMAKDRATIRSARWAPTRRSRCCRTSRSCCSTTSSRTSRRSPTRRSIRSARSW